MENQLTVIQDNFNLQAITAGSKDKAIKAIEASSNRSLFAVSPDKLTVLPDFNVRVKNADYSAKVREIADSIKANGFYSHKPIVVITIKQDGQDILAVTDGHTRLDAVALAKSEGFPIEQVFVSVASAGTTLEDITVGLVTNNSGRQLEPMALGIVCKRLIGYGLDNSTIAKRLAFTPAYVGQLLQLVGAEKAIRDLVNDGKISATLAVQTMNAEGEKAAEVLQEAVQTAKESGKGKATAKHVKRSNPAPKASIPAIAPAAKHQEAKHEEPDNSPVAPLMPTASVTPFDAMMARETEYRIETAIYNKGVEWIAANIGIVDHSHIELIIAMTGGDIDTLKAMLK